MNPEAQGEALDKLIEAARLLRWRLVQAPPGSIGPLVGRPPSAAYNPGVKFFGLVLPGKATRALLEAGIDSREQLLGLSVQELHEIKGLGRVGVSSIRRALLEVGVRLRLYPRAA